MDKLWDVYFLLPHCQFNIRQNRIKSRLRFDYNNNSDISLITANCIGGEIYSILGLRFLSPLINTAMNRKQFITMCEHLKDYMQLPLRLHQQDDGRVVGTLGDKHLPDIDIFFEHENNLEMINEEWNRRKKRINWDKIVLICDDKDIDDYDYARFDTLKAYKKIMLTAKNYNKKYSWAFQMKEYEGKNITGSYNGKTAKGGWRFQYTWDFVDFLNYR